MSPGLELEPGEKLLKMTNARAFYPLVAEGKLYLTTERIFWERSNFNIPIIGPHSFSIRLSEIKHCFLRNAGWQMSLGYGRFIIVTTRQDYPFLVGIGFPPIRYFFANRTAREWQETINGHLGLAPPSEGESQEALFRMGIRERWIFVALIAISLLILPIWIFELVFGDMALLSFIPAVVSTAILILVGFFYYRRLGRP